MGAVGKAPALAAFGAFGLDTRASMTPTNTCAAVGIPSRTRGT
jgi:hypothetical protein